jgi:DNA-binding response OmpR family regulator
MSTHSTSNVREVLRPLATVAAASGETNLPRILVVDDDIAIRQLSTDLLTRSGYHVDAAEDGAVAWNTLQTNHYDLVVTDHNMPKVSGIQLVKKLRAARMALPVILVSGALPTEELDRHPRLRLAATLLKPFTAEELLLAVTEVLRATARAPQLIASVHGQQSRAPAEDGLRM